jgi:2-dehydro-3-deoxyphosphogalactonate aldolase
MNDARAHLDRAFKELPLVAILRGVQPHEVEAIAHAFYEEGFRIIEVPMNSPQALDSIRRLAKSLPQDALLGAGTVLTANAVSEIKAAGGKLIVMPHADVQVIKAAKENDMVCIPGIATPTEAFAALHAGADALKLFPAELVPPAVMKAMRAVLPGDTRLLPVGGITPDNMEPYRSAGAAGFGLGSALYAPGIDAAEAAARARRFVQAWRRT